MPTPVQTLPGRSLSTAIETQLLQAIASPINPDRSNSGKMLWTVYFWQVVKATAEKQLKAAWTGIQGPGGLVEDDDKLRALTIGEHICAESNKFTAIIKIDHPRKTFNADLFIEKAARRFRVTEDKVRALIEECKEAGNAPLTKRVLELE